MVIQEIKNPSPLPASSPEELRKDMDPAERAAHVKRIDRFSGAWNRRKSREDKPGKRIALSEAEQNDVRNMIDRVNQNLESHGIMIHLVLIKDNDGFFLDVYDCTNEHVCTIVRDMVIDLDELPHLLANLHHETGLIVDTLS
ncbi:MAG: hypothetical protein KKE17_13035 [Proteobacteria bacterium]|nr:hypothetical protein [Pseudomonadota bacterium]MBU1710920.1 hypothetical protein [Pseudomonadota bacterium]